MSLAFFGAANLVGLAPHVSDVLLASGRHGKAGFCDSRPRWLRCIVLLLRYLIHCRQAVAAADCVGLACLLKSGAQKIADFSFGRIPVPVDAVFLFFFFFRPQADDLKDFRPEFTVLSGWMLNSGRNYCVRLPAKNFSHAWSWLLPFTGRRCSWQCQLRLCLELYEGSPHGADAAALFSRRIYFGGPYSWRSPRFIASFSRSLLRMDGHCSSPGRWRICGSRKSWVSGSTGRRSRSPVILNSCGGRPNRICRTWPSGSSCW